MQKIVPLEAYVEIWTREAMKLHGDNWPKIASFIELRMKELSPAARTQIEQSAALVLASPPLPSKCSNYH